MFCREGLEIDGGVSLRGAYVKGQLSFNQATLRNPGEVALDADAGGEVRLTGQHPGW